MLHVWAGEQGTLDPPNPPILWTDMTFGIFVAQWTIAVNYKMAQCDSFTGIRASPDS